MRYDLDDSRVGAPLDVRGIGQIGDMGGASDESAERPSPDALARRHAEERLRAIVEASPLAIVAFDTQSRVTLWSPAAERTFGWTAEEVLGECSPHVPDDKLQEHLALRGGLIAGERFTGFETRRRHKSGTPVEVRISAAALSDASGRFDGYVAFFEDIDERKRAERAIRRLASVPEQSPQPLVELDLEGNTLYANQAARSRLRDVQALGTLHPALANLRPILARFRHGETRSFSSEVAFEGRTWHQMAHAVPDSNMVRVFLLDVTEQHRASQLLEREASHDRLTGLPNRDQLLKRIEERMAPGARRSGFAILALDVDRLGVVNDSLGHAAGDELLVTVARRLAGCLAAGDVAARLSGDEFALLLADVTGAAEGMARAARLREAMGEPVKIAGQEIFPSASIGVAPAGEGTADPQGLLRDAHIAMYRAKALGGGRHELFERSMRGRSLERLRLENDLRRAVEKSELVLHFQPILRLADGAIAGFEALMRWRHPERGLVMPWEFIPLAEETGLIHHLTHWALDQICRTLPVWGAGAEPFPVHVNLSSRVLSDLAFADFVGVLLAETGTAGERLVVELTESALAEDPDAAAQTLSRVRELGLRVALDDFGTGYSSLSYLERFPVDMLKIDRSFVARLGDHAEGCEVLTTILALARRLGVSVVAEGVETESQLARLRSLGCGFGQGHLFGRPVEADLAYALTCRPPAWSGLLAAAPAPATQPC